MHKVIVKFSSLMNPVFIWFTYRFLHYFNKTMKNCFIFLILQRFKLSVFDEKPITHIKYLILQSLQDIDPISAKSAAQLFSWNLAYIFLFPNFLITSCVTLKLALHVPLPYFPIKKLDIHHIVDLVQFFSKPYLKRFS